MHLRKTRAAQRCVYGPWEEEKGKKERRKTGNDHDFLDKLGFGWGVFCGEVEEAGERTEPEEKKSRRLTSLCHNISSEGHAEVT